MLGKVVLKIRKFIYSLLGGKIMPTKDALFYIGIEEDGTKVYWSPYYHRMEHHKPDGTIIYVEKKSW